MSEVIAKSGEPVTDVDGRVICYVKNDLHRSRPCNPNDFHRFAEGEKPWAKYEPFDARCFKGGPEGRGVVIRINGEWRS